MIHYCLRKEPFINIARINLISIIVNLRNAILAYITTVLYFLSNRHNIMHEILDFICAF